MEKLDKERYLKRVIIVCWIALAICFGIKLFGGNLFEIMCNNENFIKVCTYADNHSWAYYLISTAYCFISNYFFICALLGKWKMSRNQLIIFSITTVVVCFVKMISNIFGLILDLWQAIIMPCVFTIKNTKRHWIVLIGNVLVFAFQTISLLVKNLSFGVVTDNGLLISIIYSIDVMLMLILYYLYSNFYTRKEKENGHTFYMASRKRCSGIGEGKAKKTRGDKGNR
jgi:hypothetical protein